MTTAPRLPRRILLRLRQPLRTGIVHEGSVFRQDARAAAVLAALFMLLGATCDVWFPLLRWWGVGAVAFLLVACSTLFVYPEQETWRFAPKRLALWLIPAVLAAALIAALLRSALG